MRISKYGVPDPLRSVLLPASCWRVIWSSYICALIESKGECGAEEKEQEIKTLAVLQRAGVGFLDAESIEFWEEEARGALAELGYEMTPEHISVAAALVK